MAKYKKLEEKKNLVIIITFIINNSRCESPAIYSQSTCMNVKTKLLNNS